MLKGVQLLSTGNITHPSWLNKLEQSLTLAPLPGLYQPCSNSLKKEIFPSCQHEVYFLLGGEVCNIYKKKGKTWKAHNLIYLPHFQAAKNLQKKLAPFGNLHQNVPQLNLDAKNLLEILTEISEHAFLIPVHLSNNTTPPIYHNITPQTLKEFFEDMSDLIFALEINPIDQHCLKNFDLPLPFHLTHVRSSNASQPQKIGQAGLALTKILDFYNLKSSLQNKNHISFAYWTENLLLSPKLNYPSTASTSSPPIQETFSHPQRFSLSPPQRSTPELKKILQTIYPYQKIEQKYMEILQKLGPELKILWEVPLETIEKQTSSTLKEAISQIRNGQPLHQNQIFLQNKNQTKIPAQKTFYFYQPKRKKKAPIITPPTSKNISPPTLTSPPLNKKLPLRQNIPPNLSKQVHSLLTSLSTAQKEAVTLPSNSYALITGPAGTGKTTTLLHRILYETLTSLPQEKKLLIFSTSQQNKKEIYEKLAQFLPPSTLHQIQITTFSDFALHFLIYETTFLTDAKTLTLLDELDKIELLQLAKQKQIPSIPPSNRSILDEIAYIKCHSYFPEDLSSNQYLTTPNISGTFQLYQKNLEIRNLFDLEDILLWHIQILKLQPHHAKYYQQRYQTIFIDEYQEITSLEFELLHFLGNKASIPIFAAGNPDQCISSYRGANMLYCQCFHKNYPNAKIIYLSRQYRTTKTILQSAINVLDRNLLPQSYFPTPPPSSPPLFVFKAKSPVDEGERIATIIQEIVQNPFSILPLNENQYPHLKPFTFQDIAILYRLKSQALPIECALNHASIPYQKLDWHSLREDWDIRKLISILRLLYNPNLDIDTLQFLKHFHQNWSENFFLKLKKFSQQNQENYFHTLQNNEFQNSIQKEEKKSLQKLLHQYHQLQEKIYKIPIQNLVYQVLQTFDLPKGREHEKHFQNKIQQLLKIAQPHKWDLPAFLRQIALQTDKDTYQPHAQKVNLLTIHNAKGTEFPVVFLPGCEKKLMPYLKKGAAKFDRLNEEKRLFYTALTRGKQLVILSYCTKRVWLGQKTNSIPSPFLKKINKRCLKSLPNFKKKRPTQLQLF